jgi:hypothetical protein
VGGVMGPRAKAALHGRENGTLDLFSWAPSRGERGTLLLFRAGTLCGLHSHLTLLAARGGP